jgi:protein arginine kinase
VLDFDTLVKSSGEWLKGVGPESDVVISTRIRLARNLDRFPFPPQASEAVRGEIEAVLRSPVMEILPEGSLGYVRVDPLNILDRQFLVERQVISREHSEAKGPRGVGIGPQESMSLMVNEEDHLRMQVLRSGMALDECWAQINQADDALQQKVSFAFSEEFGYLTACPTNVGTGMRVSLMLHLPALVMTKEIQKVFQSMHKMNLAVRGLYGEGSQAMGDFYQVSNQITLGKSEQQIIETMKQVIPDVLEYERRTRREMVRDNRDKLHDKVSRALGILRCARTITSEETMHLLSNELFIHTQPAHLQKVSGGFLESGDRNATRAAHIRAKLGPGAPPAQEDA